MWFMEKYGSDHPPFFIQRIADTQSKLATTETMLESATLDHYISTTSLNEAQKDYIRIIGVNVSSGTKFQITVTPNEVDDDL